MKPIKDFDRHGTCPICHREFRGDDCPHSVSEAQDHVQANKTNELIRKIVREELKKAGVLK